MSPVKWTSSSLCAWRSVDRADLRGGGERAPSEQLGGGGACSWRHSLLRLLVWLVPVPFVSSSLHPLDGFPDISLLGGFLDYGVPFH